jgi:hypothetical protein
MSKEHIEKMGGEWPPIPPGNTVAGNMDSSNTRVPVYRQMVKEFFSDYEEKIDSKLKDGWLVKTIINIDIRRDVGIIVIFERCD